MDGDWLKRSQCFDIEKKITKPRPTLQNSSRLSSITGLFVNLLRGGTVSAPSFLRLRLCQGWPNCGSLSL
ncbi:unnamed protein product [Clavelina lepadiformis]|uniref:Uncharacterized protein n=1 Tax=Clavelina lepadiformis TaxID=159417 RepID=A0ABP0FXF1_CLALP